MPRCAVVTLAILAGLGAAARADGVPPVALDSPEGERLLVESRARGDYFHLSPQLESQSTQSLCGAASVVVVLNALPIAAPPVPAWAPHRRFTQDNIFNEEARRRGVARGALTLQQLAELVESHPARAEVHYASDTSLQAFRQLAARLLREEGSYVIVNFLRSAVGQGAGDLIADRLQGHFSPLAAYHEGSDRFLVLDVARYKYRPTWLQAELLWRAMSAIDADSGKSRGFLTIDAAAGAPPPAAVRTPRNRLVYVAAAILLSAFLLGVALGALWTRRRLSRAGASGARHS